MDAIRVRTNGYDRLDRYSNSSFIEDSPQEEVHSRRTSNYKPSDNDFDDLYDITEDEAEVEDIPIQISMSPNTQTSKNRSYPRLVIPSPTAWPTIEKLRAAQANHMSSGLMTSPALVSPKPEALNQLSVPRPSTSNAPSLDGSLTSEDLSNVSCPSTPDNYGPNQSEDAAWSAPLQLHPRSLDTLLSLSRAGERESHLQTAQTMEMQEAPRPVRSPRIDSAVAPFTPFESGELSALSIPSPGGFFSESNRDFFFQSPDRGPSTSIAETFYSVPFDQSNQPEVPQIPQGYNTYGERIVESVIEYDYVTDGPPTASQGPNSARTITLDNYVSESQEYNEDYEIKMRETSVANLDRTATWLQRQPSYLPEDESESQNSTPVMLAPIEEEIEMVLNMAELRQPNSARSSADVPPAVPPKDDIARETAKKDTTFVRGFEHLKRSSGSADAFIHRKTRTERLRIDRKCLVSSHVKQLEGNFKLASPCRGSSPVLSLRIPDSITEEETKEKEEIENALKERKAMDQINAVSWNLEATKLLNGGSLLTSPTGKSFGKLPYARALDLGGQASCDWAWQVAVEYPNATVYTACTEDQQTDTSIQSPENHKTSKVPNLWTLPFPDNYFDLISARHLYSQLKTDKPVGRSRDEYDLCLRECLRVLRPGGYLEFALMDADLLGAGRKVSALSVEFAFNLKNRGYDPAPTKSWLMRMHKSGFSPIRRAWLVLPMSRHAAAPGTDINQGTTADASHISGLVGSWAWERWMLKLQKEMGKDSDRLLEGVAAALEEGAKTGASWRYLSGWARKPY